MVKESDGTYADVVLKLLDIVNALSVQLLLDLVNDLVESVSPI